jgi:archaellum biogenesis protein FlaJ (TadC family)
MTNIYDRSYQLFKPLVDPVKYIFAPLDQKLKMARIKTSYEKYGAFIFLMSSIVFTCAFIFIAIFGSLILGVTIINFLIYLILSLVLSVGAALFFYMYPNFKISEFRGKMDNSLPFVTIYLSTIMRSGLPPQEMFKLLGKFKQYKTTAREARKINSDVEYLGLALPKALDKAIIRSPSPDWSELLAGIRNSIVVGGDTGKYLDEKAKGFIQKYKRRLADFSKMIALFMNIYITVVIVGLVFFIVISSLMVTIGGMSVSMIKFMQYVIIFIGLPVITGVFVTMIKSASPWGVED